ncbi:MAG TPA: response regulator [bacterium]|nr:response regulator [bacterium]
MYTVLIADDEPDIHTLLLNFLDKKKIRVVSAFDGKEALEKIASEKPDLVLLDVMMPQVDGRDVMAKVKTEKDQTGMTVLIFSARGDQNDRLVGLELGADDYISKPTHMGSLARKIEYILEKKPPRSQG